MENHYEVLIIGGGTAGIMVAAQLKKANSKLKIGLLDPAEVHYYQPAWTLVGANAYDYDKTSRPMKSLIPSGVDWIKKYAETFEPESNKIKTKCGSEYSYDYLVACPGIKIDLKMIEGLEEAIDKGVVCSNYTNPKHTWEVIRNFKGGNAVFTQPTTPIKCGGAPQKIAYLASDYFRKTGILPKTNVFLATPGNVIFAVKEIAATLMNVINRYGIHLRTQYALEKIDSKNKIVKFKTITEKVNQCVINQDKNLWEKVSGEQHIEIQYDMLHLAPPQTAPDFIRNSPLAAESGWIAVNKETLQHRKYPNIFGLGDAAELPTAKTGAAIRKQVPIVVANLLELMKHKNITDKKYNGYSSCPLVTGYGKMVLAEFDYANKFIPDPKLKRMLIFNSDKEHYRLWLLKKHILPYLYWNKMMKGEDV